MSHARLSPSAAKRWMTCPASVSREAGLPDKDSEASLWGTAAHAILERALLTFTDPRDAEIDDIVIPLADGSTRPIASWGAWDIQEMRDCARVAYEHVLFAGEVLAETKTYPGHLIGRDDCHGTADITVLNPGHLEVVDLKSGKGVIVEPDDPQLKLYALGKIHEHRARLTDDAIVVLTIVQPRAQHRFGPIRSHTTTVDELLRWAEEEFAPAALLTDLPDPMAIPSEEGCRFCKAKATCPELAQKGLQAAQAVFAPIPAPAPAGEPIASQGERAGLADKLTRDPTELSPDEIRFILDHEKLITGWLSAVREHASESLKAGRPIPGYKLVSGRSSRNWSLAGDDLYKKLKNFSKQDGSKLGKVDLFVQTLVSPAQAEKAIKPLVASSTWARISEYITKSSGAPTLAPESDSRPALLTNAADIFKPIEQAPAAPTFELDFLN